MEEPKVRTLVLPDSRGGDRILRVTWHPATSTVVFSHWTGSVCTASTPVSLVEASKVIELLAGALRGLAHEALTAQTSVRPDRGAVPGLLRRLRRGPAAVSELPRRLLDGWDRRAAR